MSERDESQVGSLAEEAAKLFTTLTELAGDATVESRDKLGLGDVLHQVNAHVASGEDCRYCPVCRLIAGVRATSPEVRQHLTAATASLLQAAVGLLSTDAGDRSAATEPVEHIDLDSSWEDES